MLMIRKSQIGTSIITTVILLLFNLRKVIILLKQTLDSCRSHCRESMRMSLYIDVQRTHYKLLGFEMIDRFII